MGAYADQGGRCVALGVTMVFDPRSMMIGGDQWGVVMRIAVESPEDQGMIPNIWESNPESSEGVWGPRRV